MCYWTLKIMREKNIFKILVFPFSHFNHLPAYYALSITSFYIFFSFFPFFRIFLSIFLSNARGIKWREKLRSTNNFRGFFFVGNHIFQVCKLKSRLSLICILSHIKIKLFALDQSDDGSFPEIMANSMQKWETLTTLDKGTMEIFDWHNWL